MQSNSRNPTGILINGRFLTQQVSGVQSFARSVCNELVGKVEFKIVVPRKGKLINDEFEERIIRFGRLQGHWWEQLELPSFVKQHSNTPLLNLCNTAPLSLKNQAVTIHDLAFLKNPDWFHPAFSRFYKFMVPRICAKSRIVLTVSETIKQELTDVLKIPADKIMVIGNKVDEHLLEAKPEIPQGFPFKKGTYFLMVGSDDPRKNFAFAERIFEAGVRGYGLVIAGGSHRNFNTTQSAAATSKLVYKTGYLRTEELKWLYQNSEGLISPSLYEGFGIPNLEAFAMGCPVFCSDLAVFHEIGGDAATYFDITSQDSFKKVLDKYLDNKAGHASKISTGKVIFERLQTQNRSTIILNALTQ